MSQWIIGRQGGKRQRRGNGLLQASGIAQCTNQSMMGLEIVGIRGNRSAKAPCGLRGIPGGKLFEPLLRKPFGLVGTDLTHGFL